MTELYLTAYNGKILGPIALGLGWIMDKIYLFLQSVFGINNVALTIIIFTIFIYLCLFPLTYKQQKFSILQRKMQPEIKAVQNKYKGKKDTASMQAMQEETQVIYDKYGISPTGSCLQMAIQMPILFALYRVFYNVPAYVGSVKGIFTNLVSGIMGTKGYADSMQSVFDAAKISNVKVDFTTHNTSTMKNYIVDVLYKLNDSGWNSLSKKFPDLHSVISSTHASLNKVNYLFTLNISDTPMDIIKNSFSSHAWLILFCALLLPIVSYLSQMINMKLIPMASGDDNDQMVKQMRTMNMMMPLMSLVFAFITPVGLVLYWIAGSVIRIIQQIFLNRHFEKLYIFLI